MNSLFSNIWKPPAEAEGSEISHDLEGESRPSNHNNSHPDSEVVGDEREEDEDSQCDYFENYYGDEDEAVFSLRNEEEKELFLHVTCHLGYEYAKERVLLQRPIIQKKLDEKAKREKKTRNRARKRESKAKRLEEEASVIREEEIGRQERKRENLARMENAKEAAKDFRESGISRKSLDGEVELERRRIGTQTESEAAEEKKKAARQEKSRRRGARKREKRLLLLLEKEKCLSEGKGRERAFFSIPEEENLSSKMFDRGKIGENV